INTKAKEYTDRLAELEKLQNEVDETKKKADKANDDANKVAAKLKEDNKELKNKLDKEMEKTKPPNVLDYDQPKGKVVDIERSGSVVYVNLGTNDYVKPQLTFSIFGTGANGKALAQRKGALEITNILGPTLSKARITEMTDGSRDPVLKGDLLFNPAWTKSLRQHVAIAG